MINNSANSSKVQAFYAKPTPHVPVVHDVYLSTQVMNSRL